MKKWLCLNLLLVGMVLFAQKSIPIHSYDSFIATVKKQDNVLYVVNFWATTCKPCIKEMPYFVDLKNAYAANTKVKLVLASLDFKNDLTTKVLPFAKKRNITQQVVLLHDPKKMNEWIAATDSNWDGAIPATVWYKNGKKVAFHSGEITRKELFKLTQKSLKK